MLFSSLSLNRHPTLSYIREFFRININLQGGIRNMSRIKRERLRAPEGTAVGLLKIFEEDFKRLQRIRFLGHAFQSEGHELRIAGGAVRDVLNGVEPQDIDFATDAHPDRTIELLKNHEDKLRIIVTASGLKHGTVAVKFKESPKRLKLDEDSAQGEPHSDEAAKPEYDDEPPYEITTLRCDKFTDGRHAEVEFIKDWKKDAERRDLTINAMFLTLDEGELIDYFGGESDLKEGRVRFVGDADLRIREDFLRILRYFRFWSRYGRRNPPDPETRSIIKENLAGLDGISGERLWLEIKKTMAHYSCSDATKLMLELGVFEHLGLKTSSCKREDFIPRAIDEIKVVEERVKTYSETDLIDLAKSSSNDQLVRKTTDLLPVILFACLIHDHETCTSAHMRMKFSNVERDSILYIVDNRAKELDLKEFQSIMAAAPRDERFPTLQKIRALLIHQGRFECLRQLDSWQVPTFPITGHIAVAEFKKSKLPGKHMKQILDPLKEEWAESGFKLTKDELERRMMLKIEELKKTLSKPT